MKKSISSIIIFGFFYGIILLMGKYSYEKLLCTHLETEYVVCHKESQQISNLYGILSKSSQKFRLQDILIKKTEHKNEDKKYYLYHIYLSSKQTSKLIYFAEYESQNTALTDQRKIEKLIQENKNTKETIILEKSYFWKYALNGFPWAAVLGFSIWPFLASLVFKKVTPRNH